jgi:transposase
MAKYEELSDEQWSVVEEYIPQRKKRADGKGRPARSDREILNGIIWILRTGARWCDLPERYPPYQTCHRRYQSWIEQRVLRKILEALAEDLHKRGEIDLSECFVDATFIGAKRGVPRSVKRAVERGQRSWQWQTLMVFQSPSTHEALHLLKSPLYTKLSNKAFLPMFQNDSLLTELTTVIDLLNLSQRKGSS